jgi:hypothetical protein
MPDSTFIPKSLSIDGGPILPAARPGCVGTVLYQYVTSLKSGATVRFPHGAPGSFRDRKAFSPRAAAIT